MSAPDADIVPSNGSHEEGDTTLALATMVPYSSDGPTLPLIEGASEHSNRTDINSKPNASREANGRESNSSNRPSKKQKTVNSNIISGEPTRTMPKMDLGPLHRPWNLLPSELVQTVESRLGEKWWEANCVPVVFTKNQNVKSGINRLKAYLTGQPPPNSTIDWPDQLKSNGLTIAASAQGEATTKLVGIVEMAKRVVTPSKEGDGKAETWHMYTSLTSRVIEVNIQQTKSKAQGLANDQEKVQPAEDEEDFERMEVDDEAQAGEAKIRQTPVLIAWMSKKSIPEFKKAFGEQTFTVQETEDD